MVRPQLARMAEPRCTNEFCKCLHRLPVEVCDTLRFVSDHNCALARPVLTGDTGRTAPGMALLRLDTPDGKHEPTRGIAPISAQRHGARHIEARRDFARSSDFDALTQIGS